LGRLRILRRICGKNNKTHLTPKFIAMNCAEDIDERSSIAAKLLKNDSLKFSVQNIASKWVELLT
jgi:hypothetical protein